MTAISRSLWFICIVVLLGLDIVGAEAVGQPGTSTSGPFEQHGGPRRLVVGN